MTSDTSTIITRRVRTPNLKSYDESMALPIEIHFGLGPVPRALAVYEDNADVLYADLGALCDAHQLDPEVGLGEARAAELEARAIVSGGPWVYIRSDNDGSQDDTLMLVRLENPERTLAIEIRLGTPGRLGQRVGIYSVSGHEIDLGEMTMGTAKGRGWEVATDMQIVGEEALAVARQVEGKLNHGLSYSDAAELVKNGGAALLSLEVSAIFASWAVGKTTVTRWVPPARKGGEVIETEVHRRTLAAESLSDTRDDWDDLERDEQRRAVDEWLAANPSVVVGAQVMR